MSDKSNDGSDRPRKSKKERVWTETELKNLALVVADEKKQYAVRLGAQVFEQSSLRRNLK